MVLGIYDKIYKHIYHRKNYVNEFKYTILFVLYFLINSVFQIIDVHLT